MFEYLTRRSPAYRRTSRHVQLLVDYASPTKLANVARAELARVRGEIVLKARPFIYTVDIGNLCNLRCPLCPTGVHELARPQSFMALADFEKVLEKIEPWAFEVVLHNWGEPFLHPQFLEIVRATKRAGIGAAASSNLNLEGKGSEFLREVVGSGLDHLVASIDGTTQEVYETYRRGGCLDHVMANLKELVAIKRESGRRSPIIEWQFLVMKHNEHQADDARRIAAEIGVDDIRFTGAGLPFGDLADVQLAAKWLPTDPQYRDGYDPARIHERGYLYDEKCFYLYRAMTINPRGEVAPCCAIHREDWDFGNLLEADLDEVWNNVYYRSSRALFSKRPCRSELETACHQCPLFRYERRPDVSKRGRHVDGPEASTREAQNPREAASRPSRGYEIAKRTADVVISAAVLLFAAPILLVIAALIRFDSPGPAFFWQQRVGINRRKPGGGVDPRGPSAPERRVQRGSGRPFSLLKFRTMYADARARFPELYAYQYSREELETLPIKVLVSTKLADRDENGNVYFETGLPTDPRVTRMGAWLRRSSLDELPNFWNVLIGDMDIVGPRPDIEENFAYYAPPHRAKVDVKPGITGLAQIQGRGMLTFHQINEYDMQYVKERCAKLDLIIFCKTIVAWFTRRGAF